MKIVFKELLLVGLLAAFGGFINTLACKPKDETYNWKRAMPEIAIAIFAGLLIHWLLKDFDISDNYRIMSVALAGYSARGVLNIFNRLFLDHIKNVKLLWLFGASVCLVLLTGCNSIYEKSWAAGNSAKVIDISAGVSPASGTITPNVRLGGSASAIAFKHKDDDSPVYVRTRSRSFFGELFGLNSSDEAIIYMGTSNETAADTERRVRALSDPSDMANSSKEE